MRWSAASPALSSSPIEFASSASKPVSVLSSSRMKRHSSGRRTSRPLRSTPSSTLRTHEYRHRDGRRDRGARRLCDADRNARGVLAERRIAPPCRAGSSACRRPSLAARGGGNTALVLDFDPGCGSNARRVARRARPPSSDSSSSDTLPTEGLGQEGVHCLRADSHRYHREAKALPGSAARELASRNPSRFTDRIRKHERDGHVPVDSTHQTTR